VRRTNRLRRRYGRAQYVEGPVPRHNRFRVVWPGTGQMLGYYPSANAAARERDADIEWSVRHNQSGTRPVVQQYVEDGIWKVIHPTYRPGRTR